MLWTHAGVLLQLVQQVFGGDEVVQQVAEAVMLIGGLQHREDLGTGRHAVSGHAALRGVPGGPRSLTETGYSRPSSQPGF